MAEAIVIPIIGKDEASASLRAVRGQVVGLGDDAKETDSLIAKLGSAVASLGGFAIKAGLAVATTAFVGFGAALASGVQDARAAAITMAQTEAVITSTGGAAERSTEQISDLAASLSAAQGKSLFGDDDIQKSENLLLTFTNIKGEVFDLATAVSVDMAQALDSLPADQAIQLGKALNDPIQGISALTRVGVTFSDQQKEQIKTLQEAGDMAGAQKIILAELNKEFGGSAEAAAKADGGWAQLNDRWGEAKETMGAAVLPLLNTLVGTLNDSVMPVVETAAARFGDLIAAFQTGAEGGDILGGIINALYSLGDISPVFETIGDFLVSLGDSQPSLEGFLDILSQISPGFALLRGVAEEVLPQLQELVLSVFGTVSAYVSENGATMLAQAQATWSSIQQTITNLVGPIADIVGAVLAQVAAFWQANGDEIMAFVGSTWTQINTIIQTAMQVINESIVPALAAIASFISAHSSEIQLILGAAWQAIAGVIQAVLSTIQGVINATLAIIRGDWQGAWEAIKGVIDSQIKAIESIITGVLNIIAGIFNTTLSEIGANVSTAFNQIVADVTTAINSAVGIIQGMPAQVVGVGAAVVDTIWSGLKAQWGQLESWFTAQLEALRNKLPFSEPKDSSSPLFGLSKAGASIIDQIAIGMQANGDLLADTMAQAGSGVTAALTNVEEAIADAGLGSSEAGEAFDLLAQTLGVNEEAFANLHEALADAGPGSREVAEAIDYLTNTFGVSSDVADELREMFGLLATNTGQMATRIADGAATVSSSWVGAIGDLRTQIDRSDLPDETEDFGQYIMEGLIDGMEGMIGDALDLVDDIGGQIEEKFGDALQLGSPPPWAIDDGGFVIQGLMEGLAGGLPDLLETLSMMGTQLITRMSEIDAQLAGKLSESARTALEAERENLEEMVDTLAEVAEELPDRVHAALADAFDASADIDRQQAKNLDAVRRLSASFQAETQQALADALTEAQQIQDPEESAKFFQMRSGQILELAKLQDQYYTALADGDSQRAYDLQQQIDLIKTAQEAERKALDERMQLSDNTSLAALRDLLEQITLNVTDPGSGPLHDLLAQLYDLQARISGANVPGATPGAPSAPGPPSVPSMPPPSGPVVLPNPTPMGQGVSMPITVQVMSASREEAMRFAEVAYAELERRIQSRIA